MDDCPSSERLLVNFQPESTLLCPAQLVVAGVIASQQGMVNYIREAATKRMTVEKVVVRNVLNLPAWAA
ncbi:hypothetical protein K523DRAFT_326476 [Schizophyllum commune Tattone D]|nr:hypothetical protein K523DRAFT_326476 [Schizophyllum commune Tattone D]